MLKKMLLFVLIPLNLFAMQAQKQVNTTKLSFTYQKINSLVEHLKKMKDSLNQESDEQTIPALKLKYVQLGEKISDDIFLLLEINSKELLTYLKTNYQPHDKLIFLLHNTDPALKSDNQCNHERLLFSLTKEPEDTDLDDWAVNYDINCNAKHQPQRYGTLLKSNNTVELPVVACSNPLTKEDYERINARRKRVGLPLVHQPTTTNTSASQSCLSTPSL
jgi:hypothetical protein